VSKARKAVPPVCLRKPATSIVHGETLVDDYAWLKADNWREVLKDPASLPARIRDHLEAENAYSSAVLAGTRELQKQLVQEMRGRIEEDETSVPEADGAFSYFTRFQPGGEHPLICRQARDGGKEEVLLDCDSIAKSLPFFDLGEAGHAKDHTKLAWSSDDKGSEYYAIKVRDLGRGQDLPDLVANTTGEISWLVNGSGFYYVGLDDNHRPSRVWRHMLGTPQSADTLVYEEADAGWYVHLDETQSSAFCLIQAGDHETSETWLLDSADPAARPRVVAPRQPQVRYQVEHHRKRLIIRTNADGAEDFKLVEAPLDAPGRQNWRDLVPYRPGIMILGIVAYAGYLVRLEREDARPRIVVRAIASGEEHAIAFDEDTYALSLESGFEFDTHVLRFTYSSMTTPQETYDYDMETRERRLLKRRKVPSGHDPTAYATRRLMAPTANGETVPVSLLHRRDTPIDGSAPLLLYGYGAYGSSIATSFRTNVLSLVDRGFVFAIAHVRGGTEKGWRWYTEGKREKKPNTFTDFIAAARQLCAERYTKPGRIIAQGGSAGGMIMGVIANTEPDLFAGIVGDVPFVDVLNTMLDGELPLTPPEWPEWGNPGADRAAFDLIRSYSPYDCVRAQRYPAILALGGIADPRVTYWEPAKWVAKLRANMTGGGPVLLHINMEAGHAGISGRFDSLSEVALIYAFMLRALDGAGS
jgi:oligopeptidase B